MCPPIDHSKDSMPSSLLLSPLLLSLTLSGEFFCLLLCYLPYQNVSSKRADNLSYFPLVPNAQDSAYAAGRCSISIYLLNESISPFIILSILQKNSHSSH